MGRIICIANQKGGVGKTTTAVNLGASLGVSRKRTLVVDFDPQASATSGLGVKVEPDSTTIYDILLGDGHFHEALRKTVIPHLDVIPSSRDLIGAEIELVTEPERERRLEGVLREHRHEYRYLLIDCPPSLSLLTLNGLTAADTLLIPIQCEYYALEGLSALTDTVSRVRERLNPSLEIEGILLTMFDPRNRLCHEVADEVRAHFPGKVLRTVIPRNVRLSESPSHGLPAVLYDPQCRGAQSYLELAQEISEDGPTERDAA